MQYSTTYRPINTDHGRQAQALILMSNNVVDFKYNLPVKECTIILHSNTIVHPAEASGG